MKREVLIKVKGIQSMEGRDDAEEPVELVIPGIYERDEEVSRLFYEERMDELDETPTMNVVEFTGQSLTVHKTGLVNVDMVFEPGKMNIAFYETPYGILDMGISTVGLYVKNEEDLIEIRADYSLSMNGEFVADCMIGITAEPRNSQGSGSKKRVKKDILGKGMSFFMRYYFLFFFGLYFFFVALFTLAF